MSSAYIVACYFGARRVHDKVYEDNPRNYIDHHIEQLTKLNHSFDEILFSINGEDKGIAIPDKIDGVPVRVFSRENIGMSYGAWNYAMYQTDNKYDYYFIIEDDYIPVIDNFDKIFLDEFRDNSTAYVCSLYKWGHAAITNGMIATEPVVAVGGVPYAPSSNYGANETVGQVGFSRILETHGFGVEDIAGKYSIPFLDAKGGMIFYGNPGGQRVISPIVLERDK